MKLNSIEQEWLNSTEHYKGAYNFFIDWRKKNMKSPTHLAVFEYLKQNNFNWTNLIERTYEFQPHYQYNEINKLFQMDISIIAIALSQLDTERRINQYIHEMARNAINRQLNNKIKKRVTKIRHVNWDKTLKKIRMEIEKLSIIELPNSNEEYYYRYFNEEE